MKSIRNLLIAAVAGSTLVAGSAFIAASADDRVPVASPTAAAALTPATSDTLLHMVEEEKLAHDVYVTLADATDLAIFDRISTSESRHEAALQTLIDRYGLADPTAGNAVGEFTDRSFTELYDQLVAQGQRSATDALAVGVTIEELDLSDLRERLGSSTPSDVARVLQQLIAGSERHLAAFSR